MKRKTRSGFTLIELLLVIAIIGVLSSVVLMAVSEARVKARNTYANETIGQYRIAFNLYNNQFGHYPTYGDIAYSTCLGQPSGGNCILDGVTYSPAVTLALQMYMQGSPAVNYSPLTAEGFTNPISTGLYRCLNAECTQAEIDWILEGNDRSCGGGGYEKYAATFDDITWCSISL